MSHGKKDDRIGVKCVAWVLLAVAAIATGLKTGTATSDARIDSLWSLETELNEAAARRTWTDQVFVDHKEAPVCGPGQECRIAAMKKGLLWDFAFIFTYSPLLALTCHLIGAGMKSRLPAGWIISGALAKAMILAGLLDFAENIGIKHMVAGCEFDPRLVPAVAIPARFKWAIIHMGILFIVPGALLLFKMLAVDSGNHSTKSPPQTAMPAKPQACKWKGGVSAAHHHPRRFWREHGAKI